VGKTLDSKGLSLGIQREYRLFVSQHLSPPPILQQSSIGRKLRRLCDRWGQLFRSCSLGSLDSY